MKLLNQTAIGVAMATALVGHVHADENPFSSAEMQSGYAQLAAADRKCGEAKRGGAESP